MKLTLSRSDPEKADWLDRETLDHLHDLAAPLGDTDDTVEVVVVGDEFIKTINQRYRNIDRATNVISFSYREEGPPCEENIVGEVYISHETVAREAKDQAVDPKHLFLRFSIHGLLHVLGHDHEDEADYQRMEREEKRILGQALEPDEVEALF